MGFSFGTACVNSWLVEEVAACHLASRLCSKLIFHGDESFMDGGLVIIETDHSATFLLPQPLSELHI